MGGEETGEELRMFPTRRLSRTGLNPAMARTGHAPMRLPSAVPHRDAADRWPSEERSKKSSSVVHWPVLFRLLRSIPMKRTFSVVLAAACVFAAFSFLPTLARAEGKTRTY